LSLIQVDLFDDLDPVAAAHAAPVTINSSAIPVLNGMYYEKTSDKFISFVRGMRYYEVPAKGCGHTKEWQERIKKERSI
jgi:hypothetical protein